MDFLVPKYRRDPNEKVDSLYSGVAPGGTVTTLVKKSRDKDEMEKVSTYGEPMERGTGGRVAVLVLGGMETTLDEMEYILESMQQEKFTPRRSPQDIAYMCRLLLERRNDLVRHYMKNPSERPRKKTVRLHLPVGYRYVDTNEPGMKVLARV